MSDTTPHNDEPTPLVDFAIIGAMKSGTTTLFSWLAAHPEVSASAEKEPSFFSDEARWKRGTDWYGALFSPNRPAKRGEASTSYSDPNFSAIAAHRMAELVPNVRLVYLLRHPLERARSHYRHEVQRGREQRGLLEALGDSCSPYLARSSYWTCLEPFVSKFPVEQILVVRFEDLSGDTNGAWDAVQRHLGLTVRPRPATIANITAEKQQFTPVLRWLWERNLLPSRSVVPPAIRRAAKRMLLRENDDYRHLLAASEQGVPEDLTTDMWSDVQQLATWLGQSGSLWDSEA